MKQLRINSRQARQLIFLTLYNFIIRYRLGLLNPTDRLSRRPDYMALAQMELSLIQKGLLAKKLAGPDLLLPKAVGLCDLARTIDLPLLKAEEPCVSARLRLGRPNQSDFQQIAEEPCRSARLRPGRPDQSEFLRKADKASSGLLEVGLYSNIDIGQLIQGLSWLEQQEA